MQVTQEIDRLFSNVPYWPKGLFFRSQAHKNFMADLPNFATKGGQCLDLGAGTVARYKPFITACGLEWFGADVMDMATPEPHYRKVVDDKIDFEDDFFDVVCTFNVIEHFTNPETMFNEIARVLKPGGILGGACAFWEMEHNSFFHLTYRGLETILTRHGFELVQVTPSEYSGSVLASQRWFGGDGKINKKSRGAWLYTTVICNLNWLPFLSVNLLTWIRQTVFKVDPLKDCATLYFYARLKQ